MSTKLTRETTTVLEELQLHSRRTDIQPVSVQSSALPSGAATAAKQLADGHKVQIVDINGNLLAYGARVQSPTGNVIQVQIGPGDVVSNIPVFIDFDHHQVHEGEYFMAHDIQASLGTGTVKYGLTVPVYANPINAPHLVISCDVYNGSVTVNLYRGATFTGGITVPSYNKNQNIATAAGMTIKTGVTSTDGTLIKSFFAGTGKGQSGNSRSESEIVLASNTIYKVEIVGRAVGVESIMRFLWYEDLGV